MNKLKSLIIALICSSAMGCYAQDYSLRLNVSLSDLGEVKDNAFCGMRDDKPEFEIKVSVCDEDKKGDAVKCQFLAKSIFRNLKKEFSLDLNKFIERNMYQDKLIKVEVSEYDRLLFNTFLGESLIDLDQYDYHTIISEGTKKFYSSIEDGTGFRMGLNLIFNSKYNEKRLKVAGHEIKAKNRFLLSPKLRGLIFKELLSKLDKGQKLDFRNIRIKEYISSSGKNLNSDIDINSGAIKTINDFRSLLSELLDASEDPVSYLKQLKELEEYLGLEVAYDKQDRDYKSYDRILLLSQQNKDILKKELKRIGAKKLSIYSDSLTVELNDIYIKAIEFNKIESDDLLLEEIKNISSKKQLVEEFFQLNPNLNSLFGDNYIPFAIYDDEKMKVENNSISMAEPNILVSIPHIENRGSLTGICVTKDLDLKFLTIVPEIDRNQLTQNEDGRFYLLFQIPSEFAACRIIRGGYEREEALKTEEMIINSSYLQPGIQVSHYLEDYIGKNTERINKEYPSFKAPLFLMDKYQQKQITSHFYQRLWEQEDTEEKWTVESLRDFRKKGYKFLQKRSLAVPRRYGVDFSHIGAAAFNNDEKTVQERNELLDIAIESGFDLDIKTGKTRKTPVMLAALTENEYAVKKLLEAGVDLDQKDRNYRNTLEIFCNTNKNPNKKRIRIYKLLKRYGAKSRDFSCDKYERLGLGNE